MAVITGAELRELAVITAILKQTALKRVIRVTEAAMQVMSILGRRSR